MRFSRFYPRWLWPQVAFGALALIVASFAFLQLKPFLQEKAALEQGADSARAALSQAHTRLAEEQAYRYAPEASEVERLLQDGVYSARRLRLTDAIASYSRAIELDSTSQAAHNLRGYAYLRRFQVGNRSTPEDLAAAIADLERAVELEPFPIWSLYNLSLAYWEAREEHKTYDTIRRLVVAVPSFKATIRQDAQFKEILKDKRFVDLVQDD